MPREIVVRTPENVEITHSLAGIGSRFIAVVIDHLIQIVTLLLLLFGFIFLIGGVTNWLSGLDELANLSGWVLASLVLAYFMLFWGYFILFETLWNGQTPGKRAVRIRVVKENGSPVDFFSAAIRNIVRIMDWLPSGYAAGLLTMFFSPTYKRLGDYAAGTVVVKEYRDAGHTPSPASGRLESPPEAGNPEGGAMDWTAEGPPAEIPGVTVVGVSMVSREEYDAARRFLDRRGDLPKDVAASFARRIAEPILARLDMTPDDREGYPYELFLETLARDYLRWRDRGF
jgi:uncharacterized RDD family membrane protein YckC